MNKCLINKLKRISDTLHKDIIEPIKILYVGANNGVWDSTLIADGKILEKNIFKSEEALDNYIQTNSIVNVIKHICFDMI